MSDKEPVNFNEFMKSIEQCLKFFIQRTKQRNMESVVSMTMSMVTGLLPEECSKENAKTLALFIQSIFKGQETGMETILLDLLRNIQTPTTQHLKSFTLNVVRELWKLGINFLHRASYFDPRCSLVMLAYNGDWELFEDIISSMANLSSRRTCSSLEKVAIHLHGKKVEKHLRLILEVLQKNNFKSSMESSHWKRYIKCEVAEYKCTSALAVAEAVEFKTRDAKSIRTCLEKSMKFLQPDIHQKELAEVEKILSEINRQLSDQCTSSQIV